MLRGVHIYRRAGLDLQLHVLAVGRGEADIGVREHNCDAVGESVYLRLGAYLTFKIQNTYLVVLLDHRAVVRCYGYGVSHSQSPLGSAWDFALSVCGAGIVATAR